MVRETKTEKVLILKPFGKFLSYSGMKFKIKNKKFNTEKETDFYKVGEIILQSGNTVSVGALSSAGFWGIDVMILTASGRPVATMKSLDDDSHVKTRICQYEAYKNKKGVEIAKQLILGKIEAQTQIIKKYKLIPFYSLKIPKKEQIKLLNAEKIEKIRNKLTSMEGKYTNYYFRQIFPLFPKFLQINKREGYRAFDATNNLFNIAYEVLKWKIYRAIIKSKMRARASALTNVYTHFFEMRARICNCGFLFLKKKTAPTNATIARPNIVQNHHCIHKGISSSRNSRGLISG